MYTSNMGQTQNLITAFEALSTGKTMDDAYLLLADLECLTDKITRVGHKGITTIKRVCDEPGWSDLPVEKVLIRFRGGPGLPIVNKTIFTASVRSFLVDRLIKMVESKGLEAVLESIKTIWGINVISQDPAPRQRELFCSL